MRRVLIFINLVCSTLILSIIAILVSLFDRKGELIHGIARFWARIHLYVSGIKVMIKGIENIPETPCIFMCNHQSALDIYSLLAKMPISFRWVAKRQLFSIPFFGWAMKKAGYISLDRENPREAIKAIEVAGKKIKDGTNLVVFPEGTRSKDGMLLPFKKGVFTLAVRAGVPVVPVGIKGTYRLQPKGCLIPLKKGVIYINIGEYVCVLGDSAKEKVRLMDEIKKRIEKLLAQE
ncbi:MAG TPA: lysophospholipid acyltransferase family protein [Syntrophorhabdaceae bacterium]|nr:lysophospholipid acyltransferase family protein [Syntrophorhabdaceae bacterium]HPU30513.1 lysophospholipid acyltransferase family protein [Syntrophorhabdaceae bacterium]